MVNNRLTELLEVTKISSHAEGRREGVEAQRIKDGSAN